MPEPNDHRERVQKLLAQDQSIGVAQLKEFRMNLEATLASWEERSQSIRNWLVRTIVGCVLTYLMGIFLVPAFQATQRLMAGSPMAIVYAVAIGIWFVAAWGLLIATVWLSIVYFTRYAPALKRARYDVQTSLILELQEQLLQLRQEIACRDDSQRRGN